RFLLPVPPPVLPREYLHLTACPLQVVERRRVRLPLLLFRFVPALRAQTAWLARSPIFLLRYESVGQSSGRRRARVPLSESRALVAWPIGPVLRSKLEQSAAEKLSAQARRSLLSPPLVC